MNVGKETEQIEFKKSTSELKEGVISIASMLNKHGSCELYFGVKNDGEAIGQQIGNGSLTVGAGHTDNSFGHLQMGQEILADLHSCLTGKVTGISAQQLQTDIHSLCHQHGGIKTQFGHVPPPKYGKRKFSS